MDHEDIDHRIPEDAFGRDYNNEDNEDADIDRARWQHFRRNDDGHEDEYNKGDDDEVDFGNENNDFDISEDEQHHHFDEDKPRNNPNPCK